jgi:hypothetical protein
VVRWRPFHVTFIDCGLDAFGASAGRFSEQHEATRGWSPFNYELTFNVIDAGGRVGIAQGHAVTIDEKGVRMRTPLTDRTAYLVDRLGVSERIAVEIPPDVPTPPPPGSRTARATSEL